MLTPKLYKDEKSSSRLTIMLHLLIFIKKQNDLTCIIWHNIIDV